MKWKAMWAMIWLSASVLIVSGCSTNKTAAEDSCVYWAEDSLGYMDEDGYYFQNWEGMLYYFDISSGKTVPVCDKAECEHQPMDTLVSDERKCNAQLESLYNGFVIYGEKIYYYTGGESVNEMELHCRDLDGNNDKKVAVIGTQSPQGESMLYDNKLLGVGLVSGSESFDAQTKQSEKSYFQMFLVDLETGKVREIGTSDYINDRYAYRMQKAEDGNFYFYCAQDNQFYILDAETGEKIVRDTKCQDTAFRGEEFDTSTGLGWRYTLARGDYVFGHHTTAEGYTYFRLNIETGETDEYLSTPSDNRMYQVGDVFQSEDIYYKKADRNNPENNQFWICDPESHELTELTGEWIRDWRYGLPMLWTDTGAVFYYYVHEEKGADCYEGDIEYRYMSREDMLAGNDKYQTIYCEKWEE